MNYTFVIREKKPQVSAGVSAALFYIFFPFPSLPLPSPSLSHSGAASERASEGEREREKVESFLIKFQADVALGDA